MSRAPNAFGTQLRHWRRQKGWSQLDLAIRASTSPRHLSFLETGRSRPGSEMVNRLARALDVPLRGRNDLLVAAGLTPEFPERELNAPAMDPVRRVVDQMLENHLPFPAVAHDHVYRLVAVNAGAARMLGVQPGDDLVALLLGDSPLRAAMVDWPGWAWALVDRLRREAASSLSDPAVQAMLERASAMVAEVPRPSDGPDGNAPVWTPTFERDGERAKVLSTVASFHNARDVAVESLRVELLYPYDAESDRVMRRWLDAP